MTALEDARAALAFWNAHPDSPSGYLASAMESLIAEHEQAVKDRDDWQDEAQRLSNLLDEAHAHFAIQEGRIREARADVERLTAPPTDDEREALAAAVALVDRYRSPEPRSGVWADVDAALDLILDAARTGFRRQGLITDASGELDSALQAAREIIAADDERIRRMEAMELRAFPPNFQPLRDLVKALEAAERAR